MHRLRNRHLLALDVLFLCVAPFLVYSLRFEGFGWSPEHFQTALIYTVITVPVRLAIYWSFGLYSRLWRYASVAELESIVVAGITASVICAILGALVLPLLGVIPIRVPFSVLFTNGILTIGIVATPRLLMRVGIRSILRPSNKRTDGRRVLIAGAGVAGQLMIRELAENPELRMHPIGFVDDDPEKHGKRLSHLLVLGPLDSAAEIIEREGVDELLIAMPSAPGGVVRQLVRVALEAGIRARTMPGLYEILSGQKSVSALREVEIEDLLRRKPVKTNMEQVRELATNRVVLVTGAGGSIGSELSRQIAALQPERLVILDHAENPIFHIQNELRESHPEVSVVPVIADIRDRRRMFEVLDRHRPFAVFHAAAHKHVPLMEENVVEAVTNNVKGTKNLVEAAVAADVEHLVCISTDKAVRPTSVMGATKRVAEHVVRHAALRHGKNYVAVRFGNVLGSQGSVVPTFVRQIRNGGPVTVTDPEMRRYFMTIPEAVQLVLQAGALGKGGELFMLDMGEPVKIVDLARDLIRLSGLEPETDIAIEFTGLRPGEKLYEEMFFDHELATATDHPSVLCARDHVEPWEMALIDELIAAGMRNADGAELRRMLRGIVPDYVTPTLTPATGVPAQRRVSGGGGRPVVARQSPTK